MQIVNTHLHIKSVYRLLLRRQGTVLCLLETESQFLEIFPGLLSLFSFKPIPSVLMWIYSPHLSHSSLSIMTLFLMICFRAHDFFLFFPV